MDALALWRGLLTNRLPPVWADTWPDSKLHGAMRDRRVVCFGYGPDGRGGTEWRIEFVTDPGTWDRERLPRAAAFLSAPIAFPPQRCGPGEYREIIDTVFTSDPALGDERETDRRCPKCSARLRLFARWREHGGYDWREDETLVCPRAGCDWPGETATYGGSYDNGPGFY